MAAAESSASGRERLDITALSATPSEEVLHVACAYSQATAEGRRERTEIALRRMHRPFYSIALAVLPLARAWNWKFLPSEAATLSCSVLDLKRAAPRPTSCATSLALALARPAGVAPPPSLCASALRTAAPSRGVRSRDVLVMISRGASKWCPHTVMPEKTWHPLHGDAREDGVVVPDD